MRLPVNNETKPGEQFLADFLASMAKSELSPKTVADYRGDLELFQRWFEGIHDRRIRWDELVASDLIEYRKELVLAARLKPATVNRRLQSLRRFFRWAKGRGLISRDPSEGIKTVRTKADSPPPSLQKSEIEAILRVAEQFGRGQTKRNYALILLFLETGVRPNEVSRMSVSDVTLRPRTGSIRVPHSGRREGRQIPLNAAVRRGLQDYLTARAPVDANAPLFETGRKTWMSVRSIQNTISQLAAQAGIERIKVSPKILRNTFAVQYLKEHPGNLVELAALLGHGSLDATAVYTQASSDELHPA